MVDSRRFAKYKGQILSKLEDSKSYNLTTVDHSLAKVLLQFTKMLIDALMGLKFYLGRERLSEGRQLHCIHSLQIVRIRGLRPLYLQGRVFFRVRICEI